MGTAVDGGEGFKERARVSGERPASDSNTSRGHAQLGPPPRRLAIYNLQFTIYTPMLESTLIWE